jgi:hypothetical protein
MNRMQEAKMVPPIFIGRWTPKVFFVEEIGTDSCVAVSEGSPSACLLELSAISNPPD